MALTALFVLVPPSFCSASHSIPQGTIGGTSFGVAKNVQIRGIKVLSDTGSGANSCVPLAPAQWKYTN